MDEKLLQVIEYDQKVGFEPLMSFGSWRLAVLNYAPEMDVDAVPYPIEKHLETDEVFLLYEGDAWLLIGGDGEECNNVEVIKMKPWVIYHVRLGCWHGTVAKKGAKMLLVENKDTGSEKDTIRTKLSGSLQLSVEEKLR